MLGSYFYTKDKKSTIVDSDTYRRCSGLDHCIMQEIMHPDPGT